MKITNEEGKKIEGAMLVKLCPGKVAPRYSEDVKGIEAQVAVITEQGAKNGLPIVDIQGVDKDGNKFFTVVTADQIIGMAAIIQAAIEKNNKPKKPALVN